METPSSLLPSSGRLPNPTEEVLLFCGGSKGQLPSWA